MREPGLSSSPAHSRRELLAEIGDAADLTFVRGVGNRGDELIWAGTRELLRGRDYREIGLDELPLASGATVLLSGGGAFCRPYNDHMPEALAVAELRFDRVILLPSSFDVSVAPVREALRRTSATVFAREDESHRAIAGLCRARLAHDCAFFFGFSAHSEPGSGVLNAFRTDAERAGLVPLPDGNEDISLTSGSFGAWLSAIERHEIVRTDRAHVMIAAALMGKRVQYAPSSYFKVDAIARTWLRDFPVTPIDPGAARAPDAGADLAGAEYALVAEDGAEPAAGALEALAADLDAHPGAAAVTPLVLDAGGTVRHFGGGISEREGRVEFTLDREGAARRADRWYPPGSRSSAATRSRSCRSMPSSTSTAPRTGACARSARVPGACAAAVRPWSRTTRRSPRRRPASSRALGRRGGSRPRHGSTAATACSSASSRPIPRPRGC